jgi:G3E family GTPase
LETRRITISMPAPAEEAEECEEPLARHDMRIDIMTAVVDPENFDHWLFHDERSEEDRHRHLDLILQSKLNAAARDHKLTDSQRAKLQLAGRGDIKRFFDQVENRRQDFEKNRQSFRTGLAALQRLEPLVQIYREGAFGEGSLFAKTLFKITDDQKAVR